MHIEIKPSNTLTPTEKEKLFEWGDDIFGAADTPFTELPHQSKQHSFILSENGEPASHVGILKHTVQVAGQAITVGGIGGVATNPAYQGKGHAKQLLKEAASYFKNEWQVEFGMLFCFERLAPFYQSLGWQAVEDEVYVDVENGKILWTIETMVLPLQTSNWPEGRIDINGYFW